MFTSQQFLEDPHTMGDQHQLGSLKAAYKPPTTRLLITRFALALLGSVLIAGSLIFGSEFSSIISLTFLLLGLILIIFCLFDIIRIYRNRSLRVFVYDNGFIHRKRRSLSAIEWRNVQAVWHRVVVTRTQTGDSGSGVSGTSTSVTHYYSVQCLDGTQLEIDHSFANLKQLGKSLELETARYLFPQVLEAYQKDNTFSFGEITLTPRGLFYKASMLPWDEVESLKIDERTGTIEVRKEGKLFRWASIKLETVPNSEVLRMLVHHITGWWIDVVL